MITYTVMLHDDTIGTICDDTLDGQQADHFVGEFVRVHLYDENGNPTIQYGRLVEVLAVHEGVVL